MKIGYARVSKSDGDQDTALQTDALKAAGVKPEHIYEDRASGQAENRPGWICACGSSARATR